MLVSVDVDRSRCVPEETSGRLSKQIRSSFPNTGSSIIDLPQSGIRTGVAGVEYFKEFECSQLNALMINQGVGLFDFLFDGIFNKPQNEIPSEVSVNILGGERFRQFGFS